MGAEGRQEVVRVHDHVDERVDGAAERLVSPGEPPDQGPAVERHDAVVDDLCEENRHQGEGYDTRLR